MSLAEKCNEFISNYQRENDLKLSDFGRLKFMEAFYAGAEAALEECNAEGAEEGFSVQAEIDHFRSHK